MNILHVLMSENRIAFFTRGILFIFNLIITAIQASVNAESLEKLITPKGKGSGLTAPTPWPPIIPSQRLNISLCLDVDKVPSGFP